MSNQPEHWDDALVTAGLVDPRNGRPSRNQLAKRVGMSSSALNAVIDGRSTPKAPTIQKIADALGLDVRVVADWVGQERTERAPYAPPAEADLLTDRQRRAVDEIIRAIAAERASSRDESRTADTVPAPRDDLADRAQPDGATSRPDTGGHRSWKQARDAAFVAAADTNQDGSEEAEFLHPRGRGSSNDDRPWEQDEYGLAAKRDRNRGREARQKQDRDAEDGGA